MPIALNPDCPEVVGILQTRENFTSGDDRTQIDYTFILIIPSDLENAMCNSLD